MKKLKMKNNETKNVNFIFEKEKAFYQFDEGEKFEIGMITINLNEKGKAQEINLDSINSYLTLWIHDDNLIECNSVVNGDSVLSNDCYHFEKIENVINHLSNLDIEMLVQDYEEDY